MMPTARLLPLLYLLAFATVVRAAEPTLDELLGGFPRTELTIRTPDARQHRFDVWVATTDRHRMQGLMHVRKLPPTAGMLFIYPQPQRVGMWMKNTFIPLDMVFIREDGKVVQVEANTEPHSLKTIQANEDVVAVLELNAGTAQKLNIRPGARVDPGVFRLSQDARGAS